MKVASSQSPLSGRLTRGLLVGVRAAHSGASTTYVHLGDVRNVWRIPATKFLEVRIHLERSPAASLSALQASLRRQGRDAGLIGARFLPEPTSTEIIVRVAVGQSQAKELYDTLGLSRDEAQGVLDGIVAQAPGTPFLELGPGHLEVLWATSHPIDSSVSGFKRLAGLLIPLLTLPAGAGENDVAQAWRRQEESVRIAKMGGWLAASLAGHPERGVFHANASAAALDSLEGSLGLALPHPLREMLRQVNGGSFVADRARDEDADDLHPQRTQCDLLSTEEIQSELFDLIAINESISRVERWEGRRPILPQLLQADGSLVPWPYLPIARTSAGGDILVLEMTGAGRVLDAWHEVGPRHWKVVYERYVDFIEAFLLNGGYVKTIGQ